MNGIIFPFLTGAVYAADQGIKSHIRKNRTCPERKGLITIHNSRNSGAAYNFMDKKPAVIKWISVFFTIVVFAVFVITLGMKGNSLLKSGLSLLLGGAFSNTYDRLRRGYVTDYVSFNIGTGKMRDIVYNIGDFCIVTGALLCVLGSE